MAKLPYTYTICPPGPEPKQPTASCPEMGLLLRNSPDGDLTIKNRGEPWQAWRNNMQAEPFEDALRRLIAEARAKWDKP